MKTTVNYNLPFTLGLICYESDTDIQLFNHELEEYGFAYIVKTFGKSYNYKITLPNFKSSTQLMNIIKRNSK